MSRRNPSPPSRKPARVGRTPSSDAEIPFVSEQIRGDHDLSAFESGNSELDDWLRSSALNADVAGNSRTFVWSDTKGSVAAFFILVPQTVNRAETPKRIARGSLELIPAILLARLALDRRYHRRGWGEALLIDALRRALEGIVKVGGRLIVVDAKHAEAKSFYERYGFKGASPDATRLVLGAHAAARAFGYY